MDGLENHIGVKRDGSESIFLGHQPVSMSENVLAVYENDVLSTPT